MKQSPMDFAHWFSYGIVACTYLAFLFAIVYTLVVRPSNMLSPLAVGVVLSVLGYVQGQIGIKQGVSQTLSALQLFNDQAQAAKQEEQK